MSKETKSKIKDSIFDLNKRLTTVEELIAENKQQQPITKETTGLFKKSRVDLSFLRKLGVESKLKKEIKEYFLNIGGVVSMLDYRLIAVERDNELLKLDIEALKRKPSRHYCPFKQKETTSDAGKVLIIEKQIEELRNSNTHSGSHFNALKCLFNADYMSTNSVLPMEEKEDYKQKQSSIERFMHNVTVPKQMLNTEIYVIKKALKGGVSTLDAKDILSQLENIATKLDKCFSELRKR